MRRVLRSMVALLTLLVLAVAALLIRVAFDTGPSKALAYDPRAIAPADEIAAKDMLDIDALCAAGPTPGKTTVDIMREIRGPVARRIISMFRGEITPWQADELSALEEQLDALFQSRGTRGDTISIIARTGGANVNRLTAIERDDQQPGKMVEACVRGGSLNRDDEDLSDCILREFANDAPAFEFTHTGFLLASPDAPYRVLHTYPVDGQLAFFCEPLSMFLGVPLDTRKLLLIHPSHKDQPGLRRALEGPLSVQLTQMRYSFAGPTDAPNHTNSSGPALHTILATQTEGTYDARMITQAVSRVGYVPGLIVFGDPFLGRLLDLVLPQLDLSNQPYAKQGVFASVTPYSLFRLTERLSWETFELTPQSWSQKKRPDN